jgi:hypothetical protein
MKDKVKRLKEQKNNGYKSKSFKDEKRTFMADPYVQVL